MPPVHIVRQSPCCALRAEASHTDLATVALLNLPAIRRTLPLPAISVPALAIYTMYDRYPFCHPTLILRLVSKRRDSSSEGRKPGSDNQSGGFKQKFKTARP